MFNNNKRYTCKSLYRRYIAPQAETLLLQRISACLWCDSGGIQTHDLQNRNLTLYSAKLRNRDAKVIQIARSSKLFVIFMAGA